MKRIFIEYDTFPIGKKGNIAIVPDKIYELLNSYYNFFSTINKIEGRDVDYYDKFAFVPTYRNRKFDFSLIRKKNINLKCPIIRKGIIKLKKHYRT